MSIGFLHDQFTNLLKSIFPGAKFNILKREKNNRILSLITAILLAALPNLFIFKINGCILLCFLKESTQHIHIKRLAKTSWSCKERYQWTLIDKFFDHHRFIHIVVFCRCPTIIRNPHRQWLFDKLFFMIALYEIIHLCIPSFPNLYNPRYPHQINTNRHNNNGTRY